jgi:hypothetical protein
MGNSLKMSQAGKKSAAPSVLLLAVNTHEISDGFQ